MRNKISATLALVALLVGESWAVNHVELVATGPGVTPPDSAGITNNIEINTPLTLNLIITNDVPYTGASLGWTIYSPDGSISTVTQNGVQSIPPWDITSFDFFQTNHFRSWDGILPDSVQTTGFSMVSNFPVSVGVNFLDINLMLTHQGVFCIDSARVSAAGEWLVIAQGGAEIAPTWGGGANGYCFKTFTSGPNLPCTFDNPPSQAIIPLPGDPTVSVDFDAIDPDGPSPCVFSIVSGPGAINSATGLFSIDTADFFPGDTAALTVVRVEDQAAAGTNHNLTTIINDTTFRGEVRLEVRAEDGHGADTLFVNQPGKIHAVYSSNRPTFAMEMQFSIASSPGPGTQYLTLREGDMVFDTGAEPFNLKLYDPRFQNGTSPDT
ncbi:MAG: hypothetical protein ACE5GA_05935, partial [Candidatus Zixiibacteriota bacterium]